LRWRRRGRLEVLTVNLRSDWCWRPLVRTAAGVVLTLACASPAAADEVEILGALGHAQHADQQSFFYRLVGLPLVSVEPSNPFNVRTNGERSLTLGVTWFFRPLVGVESTLDVVSVRSTSSPAAYRVRIDGLGSLPGVSQEVLLKPVGSSVVHVPIVSVGVRFHGPLAFRRLHWTAAGGMSWVPGGDILMSRSVEFGPVSVGNLQFALPRLGDHETIAEFRTREAARLGGYAAGGVEVDVARHVRFRGEVRHLRLPPSDGQNRSGDESPFSTDAIRVVSDPLNLGFTVVQVGFSLYSD
jgi:hypothetical protein